MEALGTLFPFLLILVAFWLLIIRPARNRQRAQRQLQNQLTPGQRVMTTSGLFATISAVEDDAIVLESAPGVTMRWSRAAVARVLPADEDDATADEVTDEAGEDADRDADSMAAEAAAPEDSRSPGEGRDRAE